MHVCVAGWWRSPSAVQTVAKYEQVVNVVSNATLSSLGLSLLFFLTQSYLVQKHPTLGPGPLTREARALCAAPLLASLGSAHFLLAQNKLVLADTRGMRL
jgi:dsRNA-specific ribonuclease